MKKNKGNLQNYNEKLDALLIQIKLKKKEPHPFEHVLPEFIQEILLNMSCDMTIEKALRLAIQSNASQHSYMSLNEYLIKQASSIQALNLFSVECNSHEIWKLSRLVNQNYLTGSENTYTALERYHDELWQNKLQLVKIKSEKVGIYLTFLLMLSLLSIIVVIVSPIVINL